MMTKVYMAEKYHKLINNHQELAVYQIAFKTVMTIFEIAQNFPNVEKKTKFVKFSPITSFFPLSLHFPVSPFVLLKNEIALPLNKGEAI